MFIDPVATQRPINIIYLDTVGQVELVAQRVRSGLWNSLCEEMDKNGIMTICDHFDRDYEKPKPYHMEHILCL